MLSQRMRIKPRLEGEAGVEDDPKVKYRHEELPLSEVVLGGPPTRSKFSM